MDTGTGSGIRLYRRSVLVTEEYPNMLRLFPTAQFPVQEVVQYCKTNSKVERVTVFGSALETRHNPWSDIDLYVEGVSLSEFAPWGRTSTRALDVITPEMLGSTEALLHDIKMKGVVVYERNSV